MLNKIVAIIQYIRWLVENCHALRQHGIRFKIAEIKIDQRGENLLAIQSTNHTNIFWCKPTMLTHYEHLLDGFSKRDIRTITYLAIQETFQPKYKIISQHFCESLKQIIFKLRKRGSVRLKIKTADEITRDKRLLKELNQEDAHRIGYVTALEQCLHEKEFLERIKREM